MGGSSPFQTPIAINLAYYRNANEDIRQKQLHRCEQSANEGKNQKRPKEEVYHVSKVKEKKWGIVRLSQQI